MDIVKIHGIAVNEGAQYYPTQMFETHDGAYNMNVHMLRRGQQEKLYRTASEQANL